MHVVLVTHYYHPEVGAPQRRWGALIPRFLEAGHQVTVLAPSPHYPAGHPVDLERKDKPGKRGTGPWGEHVIRLRFREHGPDLRSRVADQLVTAVDASVQGLLDLHGRRRPDVMVVTIPGIPSIFAGGLLKRALRVPLVVEMRDAWPDLVEASGMLGTGRGRRGWRARAPTQIPSFLTQRQRRAAAVVTTTESFADVLRLRGVERVDVIRNGAALDEVPYLGPRQGEGPLRVAYVGTVGRAQGLHTAVEAAAELARRGTPIDLRIVGGGAELERLEHLSFLSGADVDIRGRVPRAEVIDHYRWADSILVSLRDWEPMHWTVPSKLYESLATGRHVTGVVEGEAEHLITRNGAGHVSPPEDPGALADLWQRLATHRDELAVGDGGRAWAMEHSDYDRLAAHYLALLEDVRRRR